MGNESADEYIGPFDDEQMMLLFASPPRMISPCSLWSPMEFFELMPPGSPVGSVSLWNSDDEHMFPLQMPPVDAAATSVAAPGRSHDADTDSASNRVEHINNEWVLPISRNDERTDDSHQLKVRVLLALSYYRESTDQQLLVQIWAPVMHGDRCELTTLDQPFWLHHSIGLIQYKEVLRNIFTTDGDKAAELGLPGLAYIQKVPEWTPNVQYYSSTEYLQLNHAISDIDCGTVALPVFDAKTQSCIAVIELIMGSKKINHQSEVHIICTAQEAVNLKGTEIFDHPSSEIHNEGRQSALVEIRKILEVICDEHKLPLAQTWVPCKYGRVLAHGGVSKRCLSFDGSCTGEVCISSSNLASHVVDAHMWGFRDACVYHHLQVGQGVSGKAMTYRRPCFSKDVKKLCKRDYPLAYYARMFGLTACLAVCLQSSYTGNDDYILEFFLPPSCQEEDDQKALLESILARMKKAVRSFLVVADGDLESFEGSDIVVIENEETNEEDAHTSRSGSFESPGYKTNPTKSRAKSEVWKHFRQDGARAYCKRCNKDYAADSRRNGTSRLLRHLKDAHSLMKAVDGNFCEDCFQVNDMFANENEEPLTESPLVLVGSNVPPKRMRQNNGKAASIEGIRHHFPREQANPTKSRGKSGVWQHFRKDGLRAYCKHCNNDYAADPKKDGTSRLWRHLEDAHKISKASSAKNEKSGTNHSCAGES